MECLQEYFEYVKSKTLFYVNGLNDEDLYEKPENCEYTKIDLILGQFNHLNLHIGIFNGITIEKLDKYPMVFGLNEKENETRKGKLFDD